MVIIWLFSEFSFHIFSFAYWRIKFLLLIFFFKFQFWVFLLVMPNNQTKCGIIYEKIVMQAGDDERMIHYKWPNNAAFYMTKKSGQRFKYL